jgi:hypothetical protein
MNSNGYSKEGMALGTGAVSSPARVTKADASGDRVDLQQTPAS